MPDAVLWTPRLLIAMPLIGLAAGVLGGLLGIGGGLVMIPAMVFLLGDHLFGPDTFHSYKLAAISAAVVLSVPAVRRHVAAGAVAPRIVNAILPGALLGVLGGAALSGVFSGDATLILQRIFGAVMILSVGLNLWAARGRALTDRCPSPRRWAVYSFGVGLPAGLLAGLLGVGGGVWAVPVQNQICGVRLRTSIANSACAIIVIAVAASLTQVIVMLRLAESVWPGLVLALLLAPGALLGGSVGGTLTHVLPVRGLRHAFHVILVIGGIRLLMR